MCRENNGPHLKNAYHHLPRRQGFLKFNGICWAWVYGPIKKIHSRKPQRNCMMIVQVSSTLLTAASDHRFMNNTYNWVACNGHLSLHQLGNTECCSAEWHTDENKANVLSTATERWTRNGKLTTMDSSFNNHVVASANPLVSHFHNSATTAQVLKQRQKLQSLPLHKCRKSYVKTPQWNPWRITQSVPMQAHRRSSDLQMSAGCIHHILPGSDAQRPEVHNWWS